MSCCNRCGCLRCSLCVCALCGFVQELGLCGDDAAHGPSETLWVRSHFGPGNPCGVLGPLEVGVLYFAHSGRDRTAARLDWQPLTDHNAAVARGAARFAEQMGLTARPLVQEAFAAGFLHDLGKYRAGFQHKIRGQPAPRESTYHKQAGAAYAFQRSNHRAIACAIDGHHGGLPNHPDLREDLESGGFAVEEILEQALADCPELANLVVPADAARTWLQSDLDTRLLLSCLVDADWSDTAEHDRKIRGWDDDPEPTRLDRATAEGWLERVLTAIGGRARDCRRPEVAQARKDVLAACLTAARNGTPGLFTLTVPTGGGKTLSALAFALAHAAEFGLRRIIYVAPYLSILDQNARVIREALGVEVGSVDVFEHHSLGDVADLAGPADAEGDEQDEARRASAARQAENWDAPVVITTNVQFFESLFSNRPGRCRKLHNIARSVIILDECQAIPPELVAPTCAMLGDLTAQLGCTIVLATATPPAFDHPALRANGCGLTDARAIVGPELDLFKRLQRVHVEWPEPDVTLGWEEVGRRMTDRTCAGQSPPAALCVVNTIRAAGELFAKLSEVHRDGVFYLSTRMCPAHRLERLDEIRMRLAPDTRKRCLVVSTQLIEAGVDVDFPLVLRELGPLDAIIQAAGRCNREGLLNGPDGRPGGLILVFRSRAAADDPLRYFPRDPWYVQGRDTLVQNFLNAGRIPRIDDPTDVNGYYKQLFVKGDLDGKKIQQSRREFDFPGVAERYRLIEDSGYSVVVRWPEHDAEIERRLAAVRDRPTRRNYRRLALYQVNLRCSIAELNRLTREVAPRVHVWEGGYTKETGLTGELPESSFIV